MTRRSREPLGSIPAISLYNKKNGAPGGDDALSKVACGKFVAKVAYAKRIGWRGEAVNPWVRFPPYPYVIKKVVLPAGIEPTAFRLGGERSILLSYGSTLF